MGSVTSNRSLPKSNRNQKDIYYPTQGRWSITGWILPFNHVFEDLPHPICYPQCWHCLPSCCPGPHPHPRPKKQERCHGGITPMHNSHEDSTSFPHTASRHSLSPKAQNQPHTHPDTSDWQWSHGITMIHSDSPWSPPGAEVEGRRAPLPKNITTSFMKNSPSLK